MLAAGVRQPRPARLHEPLAVGTGKLAAGLRTLGIGTASELFEHLPTDRRELQPLGALRVGERVTVAVEVRSLRAQAGRGRRVHSLLEATVFDHTGSLRAVFFNQPWLARRYVPGTRLLLEGKLDAKGTLGVWSHALDPAPATAGGAAIDPSSATDPASARDHVQNAAIAHYPASYGVTSTQIAALMRELRPSLADVVDPLPASVRVGAAVAGRAAALAAVHFPDGEYHLAAGRRRLAFDELLLGQLLLLRRRAQRLARSSAPPLGQRGSLSADWLERGLPFALTADQLAATLALDADLARAQPMQRLLIGEVGSGKTVVALYAMLRAVERGHQATLMAPTETLAEQHASTLTSLLAGMPASVALLTSSTPAASRRKLLSQLRDGSLPIVVGTHALIDPEVRFGSLAVAVVDEQHRFGVSQRVALDAKRAQGTPHLLHLSATPIPRTLALAVYGDLDVSTLRCLPAGRQPVLTRAVAPGRGRRDAYERVRSAIAAGRQAYVVCPLASESNKSEQLRAAASELARLASAELEGLRLVLLHGQMPARDKQAAMAAFVAGEADVMVCTTVVEVGIDVPNAAVMVVENAERFGISQLHQLRGRVGRGEHASECVLISSTHPSRAPRLRALVNHADGFKLAEIDLELRGSGELAGTRQSGQDCLRVARLPDDSALLECARGHAEAIMAADPELCAPEHVLLGDVLKATFGAQARTRLAA